MPISPRGYSAGKWAVELDGINAGWVHSAEGGHATADVVTEKLGGDHLAKKHLGNVKYEDISVSCGIGMTKGFYTWIQNSFDHKHNRLNGAVITADYNYKEVSRLTFFQGLITEVGMPALDAASKDAAKMSIKWASEYTRIQHAGGGNISGGFAIDSKKQKQWLPANFRLRIDGFEEACKRVNKIEALVIKQKVTENPVGEMRDYEKEPTSVEVPNLVITFPENVGNDFYKYHEDFVIKGNCTEDKEKGGTLEYLAADLQTVLFTLTFKNLGIFKLTPDKVESHAEGIRRLKAEFYCEDIKFAYSGAATFA